MKWTRIERPIPLPAYVREAVHRLDEAGYIAYVVGGSIRDFILGRDSKDHDIATNATPDEICALFPNSIQIGKAFGVLKIPVAENPMPLEIATFRKDLDYEDHRHPKSIQFAGPVEDAERRDFTINALYYDLKSSRILDITGGLSDLKGRWIHAIGAPRDRFREDALRLFRAVRFTSTLGFKLEQETADAVKACAKWVSKVSPERVREEMNLMLTGPRPSEALELLMKFGLLSHFLPELEALRRLPQSPLYHPVADVWTHTLRTISYLVLKNPYRSPALTWATLLHNVGKPIVAERNEGKNFNGHEVEGAKIARKIAERLKFSRTEVETIASLIEDHLKFRDVFKMREATLQRFILQPHFEELLALHQADAIASDGNLAYHEFSLSRLEEVRKNSSLRIPKLIDGTDLIQLGFNPGPEFSEILRVVEDLAFERKLSSKEEALEYVVKHFVR